MANTSSAKKAARVAVRKTEIAKARRTRIRTFVKKVEAAIQTGNHAEAQTALRTAESELMRAVTKNVIKKGNASRKISRLNAQVKKLKTAKAA